MPSAAELLMIEPEEVEQAIVSELGGSALFGARFRENAARALLIPRAYPGRRTPLWQQRLKAQNLLEVARRYEDFPIILETYRECLKDVLDLAGLKELLRGLQTREISLVRGRDPDRLAVCLLAAVRLRRDLHVRGRHAGRRAPRRGALARPRPAARAARPGGAARADRPRRARARRGRPAVPLGDDQGDRPRRAARRAAQARRPERRRGRRAGLRGRRPAGPARRAPARTARGAPAGRRRGALHRRRRGRPLSRRAGRRAPGRAARGLPRRRARRPAGAGRALCPHPRPLLDRRSCTRATASTRAPCCASSSATASSCAGSSGRPPPTPASATGATWRFCAACAAPRWRRCARRSSRPTSAAWRPSCPPGRASTATPPPGPGSTACARCWCRSRASRCPSRPGSATCCHGAPAPTRQTWLDMLCASGELAWVGAGALGRSGRVALYFREDAPAIGPPPAAARSLGSQPPSGRRARAAARAPLAGTLLLHRPARRAALPAGGAARGALGPRLGGRGDQRRLGAAAGPAARAGTLGGAAAARARVQRTGHARASAPGAAPAPSPRSRAAGR